MFNNCDSYTNGERKFYDSIRSTINTVFDVGSRYDSEFTDFTGTVHYFDPVDEYIEILKQKLNKNNKSYFNSFGLSNINDMIFYYPKYQSFYDRIATCKNSDDPNKKQLIVKKGIDYVNENNIDHIDLLKIDTEGHELDVLKGFEDFLQNVSIIQFEYGGTYIDSGTKLIDVINHLKPWFTNFYYLSQDGNQLIQDFYDHYNYCNIVCFNNTKSYLKQF